MVLHIYIKICFIVQVFETCSKGLVTNYGEGGLQNGRGGHVKFYPYEKGGAEKVLAVLKGGHKKFWGSFLCGSLKF